MSYPQYGPRTAQLIFYLGAPCTRGICATAFIENSTFANNKCMHYKAISKTCRFKK